MRFDFIRCHNAKVPDSPDSLTVHVGDMFWRKLTTTQCCDIVDRLNGRHVYIEGNHEEVFNRGRESRELIGRFESIASVEMIKYEKQLIWVSHYAHRVWPKSHQGSYHVYGHTHGVLPGHRRSMDVGVDANNYAPVSFDELDARMKALGKLLPDEVEQDMLNHPWPADSGSALGEGLPVIQFDHLPEGSC
jgi:calcineurin-like phosphoesterase family protein